MESHLSLFLELTITKEMYLDNICGSDLARISIWMFDNSVA